VLVEPVAVGIFLKRARTFVELRPKTKWIELSFGLHRKIDHSRISKIIGVSGGRTFHAVRLVTPEDVNELVTDWIAEAYDLTPADRDPTLSLHPQRHHPPLTSVSKAGRRTNLFPAYEGRYR
jgi:Domain of unknown function (DUF5655)